MKTVLFACVHNAGRSQMAAAFFNVSADPSYARAVSSGTKPGDQIHPEVIQVMQEVGIDLTHSKPQLLTDDLARSAHLLITMGCGEACPFIPGLRREDWTPEDPKGQSLEKVRKIRNEIRSRVQDLIAREKWAPLRRRLAQLALFFLKLGTFSFGGPAAHIAMMEDEVVRRRKWLSRGDFLDLVGATNLIPGPNSTELAIHIGHRRAGWAGLLIAGISFILPATLIVWGIAWAYVQFGSLPEIKNILYGIKPVIIAIVISAFWRLGKTALKTKALTVFFLVATLASALGMNELLVIFGIGTLAVIWDRLATSWRHTGGMKGFSWFFAFPLPGTIAVFSNPELQSKLAELFLVFLKIGSVLFGSGYVLLAFLQADFVEHRHWLTQSQLLDAIAVGQFTPGPVFTAATFVGYVIAGNAGALGATLGIFLPAFVFVALSGPLVPRLRKSLLAGVFLNGVNAASLALMVVVSWQLGKSALVDWPTVIIAVASLAFLLAYRLNATWLILAGGLMGLLRNVI